MRKEARMIHGTSLTIKTFPVVSAETGDENRVTDDGKMTVCPGSAADFYDTEGYIKDIGIRVIHPDEHDQYTNTVMDVIPISTKALGKVGEGVTFTLGGVYVILTGVDGDGRQVCNFGSCEGTISDTICFGRAGTPDPDDIMVFFDVTCKAGSWSERACTLAIHRACDRFIQVFRDQMKKFNSRKAAESVLFEDKYVPGRKDIVIFKEVSGQGAVYETAMFGSEPCGIKDSVSVIDLQWMPIVISPNEYRDGILHAMD